MVESACPPRRPTDFPFLRNGVYLGLRDFPPEKMAANRKVSGLRHDARRDPLVRRGDLHRACRRENPAPGISNRAAAEDGAGAALDFVSTEFERAEDSVEARSAALK